MKELIKSYLSSFPFVYRVIQNLRYGLTNFRGGAAPNTCLKLFPDVVQIDTDRLNRVVGFLNTRNQVNFVQIGSNDGKQDDPLYQYISSTDTWQGVLVEPVRYLFERLKQNYANRSKLKFDNSLISDNRTKQYFYYVCPEAKDSLPNLPCWYEEIGSFNEKHIINLLGDQILPYIKKETLTSITLHDLFTKHCIKALDLLHIDTEGHDYQIIKQLNFSQICPLIILLEYKHLTYWETFKLVKKLEKRYRIFADDYDLVAVDLNSVQQVAKYSE